MKSYLTSNSVPALWPNTFSVRYNFVPALYLTSGFASSDSSNNFSKSEIWTFAFSFNSSGTKPFESTTFLSFSILDLISSLSTDLFSSIFSSVLDSTILDFKISISALAFSLALSGTIKLEATFSSFLIFSFNASISPPSANKPKRFFLGSLNEITSLGSTKTIPESVETSYPFGNLSITLPLLSSS